MKRLRSLPTRLLATLAIATTGVAIVVLTRTVDATILLDGVRVATNDPLGVAAALLAFGAAFLLRAVAWRRTLPDLSLGHALAGIHLSLGGNHVLPFRLGEALRVLSVVRRANIDAADATSSTVVLRAADLLSLLAIGVLTGPAILADRLGIVGLVAGLILAAVMAGGWVVLRRRHRAGARVRTPDGVVLVLTTAAWVLEGVLLWRVLGWFGVALSPAEVLVVLAAAISAQLVAIAPGGLGTYEAAATAALLAVGVPTAVGLPAAVAVHGLKTIYSLGAGLFAMVLPGPGIAGRLRLPRTAVARPDGITATGPILLFLPAHDEGPRVADVIRRTPAQVHGADVEVLVIDDGSTDDTADRARHAGAEVLTHPTNRGLGAAVRTGLAEGARRGASAVAFCDADGEYDPADLHRLVEPILADRADYVVGSRFAGTIQHMHPHRRLGNNLLTTWMRWTVRQPVTDGQSGFRAFSPAAAARVVIPHDYNYAQVMTIDLVSRGFGYAEVPITYRFRTSGRSFIRLRRYLQNVVPTVWRQLNPAATRLPNP